jgi:hypothetical protein
MSAKKLKFSKKEKDLLKRYLIWCYKTTKEELDKVGRYFTQLKVDVFLLKGLRKKSAYKNSKGNSEFKGLVDSFETYMLKKEDNVLKKKYKGKDFKKLQPQYEYLSERLCVLEDAISHFLGKQELTKIVNLYEEEMTKRILQAREH